MALKKIGVSFALNDIAGCYDGGTVGTDTTATLPTPTQVRIGFEGTNYANGWISSLTFYPVAKTDAELQALTASASSVSSVGSASGTGAAAATGAAQAAGVGTASGAGTALGVGAAATAAEAVGTASGAGTASAVGDSATTLPGQGIGSAAGVGAATGVSAAIAMAVGTAGASGAASAYTPDYVPGGITEGGGGGTSRAYAKRLRQAIERRRKFEEEREQRFQGLTLERPPLIPAPSTVAMIADVHEAPTRDLEDDGEEELLLLLLAS